MDKEKLNQLAGGLKIESVDEELKIVVLSVPDEWEGHGVAKPLFATSRNAIQEQGFKVVMCHCNAWKGSVVIDKAKVDLEKLDDRQLAVKLNEQINNLYDKGYEYYKEASKQMENSETKKKFEEAQTALDEAKKNREANRSKVFEKISAKKKELSELEFVELFKKEEEQKNAEYAEKGIKIVNGTAYFDEMDPQENDAQRKENEQKYFPNRKFEDSISVKHVKGNKVVFAGLGGSSIPDKILPEALDMMKKHGFENGLITLNGCTYELRDKTLQDLKQEYKNALEKDSLHSQRAKEFENTDERAKSICAEVEDIRKELGEIDANIEKLESEFISAQKKFHDESAKISVSLKEKDQNKTLAEYGYKCGAKGVPVKDEKVNEQQPGDQE